MWQILNGIKCLCFQSYTYLLKANVLLGIVIIEMIYKKFNVIYVYVTYNNLFYSLVMYRYWGESVFVMSLILKERDEMNRLCLMRGTWPLWRNLGMDIFLSHGPQLSLLLLLFSTHKLKIKVHIRMVSRWSDQKFIVLVVCFFPVSSLNLFFASLIILLWILIYC